ncbi:hypothetical protein PF005_g7920 [Phytophthora fragariae]|uniref:Uncharacterized protein n=3 Tax=Phytophthora TaxID=4783 RepID=A0A6A3YI10_9STRA|nr:hypothetical protein PF003_g5970 [Phytophthora fragariae]KAE8967765.1 hypothetical protein PR001_g28000 [Phytophthora rubi]KAE8941218.1 hypothetical protein PF009_g8991 [Phytophthora fragariae]KAE9016630.1 hypothetical protein PF011_g7071 [Phytophthora fragariae]KAE9038924.1 hypothetical protein PR002_g5769 [Phytophthora rubi]
MPLKWFRNHRRSSTSSASEDEATRSSTETSTIKQKAKRNKSAVTQRSRRSHSHGSGLRAMFGLGGSTQVELDAAAAVAAEEEQRRISYQTKTRRRFTIHGLSYHHKPSHEEAGWSCHTTPAGSPEPMSPSYAHARHFGLVSGRGQQMIPHTSEAAHPSIIFIDCPP